MSRRILPALLGVGAVLAAPVAAAGAPYQHVPNATQTGTGGAAATVDSVATGAARDVLSRGGNAVDAAVAAAAVLGVTEPFSSGVGGGGFMVIRRPNGKVTTIDSRETAPAQMRPDSFIENGAPLSFNDARYSGLSAGVPGTPAAWELALKRYGTWRFKRVLAPAIDVAREGFVVDPTFASQTDPNIPWFNDIPATTELYLDPDGTSRDPGEVLKNPDMARTYERMARFGAKRGFYRGPIAEAIAQAAQHPQTAPTADKTWRSGLITERDLRDYRAVQRKPTHIDYRGLDVYSMGPPSSGGSTVGEALNILEGYDLASMTRADAFHYFLEASRYSFADRNAYLADPAYFDVPLEGLLSDDYAATRRALITPTAAPGAVPPGDPYPYEGAETTTHLTTSDMAGNVVSYTFTIESTGGAGLLVPGFGFLLNNELTDFNFDSTTHPNRVEGGKRPRSSMAPTIVTRAGKPFLALGSPGGATIITTVLQLLLDRVDLGMTLPQAIADPRASQRNAANTGAEPAFLATPEATALGLRGHRIVDAGEIGAATGIEFLTGGGVLAAAEPVRRGRGSAMTELP